MGTSGSSLKELQDNKYLQQFSSNNHISPNEPFWNQLLSFTYIPSHNCADSRLLEESIKPMLDALLSNNPQTGNISSLIHVFLVHSGELKESVLCENKVFVWQTHNSLFILRSVMKYFIETLGEDCLLKQLPCDKLSKDLNTDMDPEKLLEAFINALIEIVVDVPSENLTYAIIVEAINMLLVLMSVQMFSTRPAQSSFVYRTLMQGKCSIHSILLVKALLLHYVTQDKCPHCITKSGETGGIVSDITSGLWNLLTLSSVRGVSSKGSPHQTVLANQSLLLLLALVNHCTNEQEVKNPYRLALFSFQNSKDPAVETKTDLMPAFRLDFDALFNTLCNTLKDDQTTLLVYLLLHKNVNFKNHVILYATSDDLVVPILKILYDASERSSHHIYMALIVLLILSEDELFDKNIHHIDVKDVSWYTERHLTDISLGGLVVLILTRTIQYNMTRMHDKYLHTNCLAALANMSAHFQHLHSYVCQKFIGLLENMARKHARVATLLQSDAVELGAGSESQEMAQDLTVLDEVIRMLLEILNSCLSAELKSNENLIYTMLYNKHVFGNFHNFPSFEDIMQNINKVLLYFSDQLVVADQTLSVVQVYKMIGDAILTWPKDSLKKFPDLKFKYVEEGQPEDFFIPYLWSLVFHASDIYWNPKNILIFNPHKII